jgi:CRISPR-associated protein Cas2
MRHCYLLCYDIAEPRRLRKVAKLLLQHGERVQKSVFECWLTAPQYAKLLRDTTAVMDANEDSLRAYRLSRHTAESCEVIGCGAEPKEPVSVVV